MVCVAHSGFPAGLVLPAHPRWPRDVAIQPGQLPPSTCLRFSVLNIHITNTLEHSEPSTEEINRIFFKKINLKLAQLFSILGLRNI